MHILVPGAGGRTGNVLHGLIPNLCFSFRRFPDDTVNKLLQHMEHAVSDIRRNILRKPVHNDSHTALLFINIRNMRTHIRIGDEAEQLLRANLIETDPITPMSLRARV